MPAALPKTPSPTEPIRLGPFVVEASLGRGAQGTVWRAAHPPTGLRVAIKVLASLQARDQAARAAFRREVRAAAGLDHPNIVVVLDQGEVSPEAEGASQGALRAGSPWLAMELAGPTLAEIGGRRTWPESRAVLSALLSALAHAHARGIVHRDLKPANVLFVDRPGSPEGFGSARLADFGLAFGWQELLATKGIVAGGTPIYMAPEQFRRDLHLVGPQADLYALGWVAWELVTGVHPLVGLPLFEIKNLKTSGWLPRLPHNAAAPKGFAAWVATLLAVDARQRPQRAADVHAALSALSDLAPQPSPEDTLHLCWPGERSSPLAAPLPGARVTSGSTWMENLEAWAEAGPEWPEAPEKDFVQDSEGSVPILPPAPVVPTWRRSHQAHRPAGLVGAGLGLLGLRGVDPVGRETIQDEMWAGLVAVSSGAGPRVLLLRGAAGEGRTTLARWLYRRVEETGSGSALAWTAGPRAASPGAAGLLSRLLRRRALAGDPAAEEEGLLGLGVFDAADRSALVALSAGERPRDLLPALVSLVEAMSRERPVVLVIDDAPFADEALDLVRRLRGRPDLRLLVLLTARDGELGPQLDRAGPIDQELVLGPLTAGASRALVLRMLGIDAGLLHELVQRAAGNPAFLLHLLNDWVGRGLLMPSGEGFVLANEARPSLPEDLHAAWAAPVELVVAQHGEAARIELEVAAALGPNVHRQAWRRALAELGAPTVPGLEELLYDRGLARPGARPELGFELVQAGLRETLLRGASDGGRFGELNRACARALTELGGAPGEIGRHLLQAGQPASAAPLLLDGATAALDADDPAEARGLVALARRSIGRLELPPARAIARLGLREGRLALREGRFTAALAGLAEVLERASGELQEEARGWRAAAAVGALDLDTAEEEANRLVQEGALPRRALRARLILAQVAAARGDQGADGAFAEVAARAALLDASDLEAQAWIGRMGAARASGALETALSHGERAVALLQRHGPRRRLAQVHNERGDLLRTHGDLAEATTAYTEAERLFDALGLAHAAVPRINLGLTLVAGGRYPAAERVLRRALAEVRAQEHDGYELAVRCALLPCEAALGQNQSADASMARVQELAGSGYADPDLAAAAELAGDLWGDRQEAVHAAAVYRLAQGWWQRLGRTEAAARVEEKLCRVEDPEPS